MLHKTITGMQKISRVTPDEIGLLTRARDARNYIADKGAASSTITRISQSLPSRAVSRARLAEQPDFSRIVEEPDAPEQLPQWLGYGRTSRERLGLRHNRPSYAADSRAITASGIS